MREINLEEEDDAPPEWAFEMEQSVKLMMTGETGYVSGRKEQIGAADQYELTYIDAGGRLVRKWWSEGAIEGIGTTH